MFSCTVNTAGLATRKKRPVRHSVYILTENCKFEKPLYEGNSHFFGEI